MLSAKEVDFSSEMMLRAIKRDFDDVLKLLRGELQRHNVGRNNNLPRKIGDLDALQKWQVVNRVFLDWVHLKLHFSEFPREVILSAEMKKRIWRTQFDEICKNLTAGFQLKPRQSRKLIGPRAKLLNFREDMMFSKFKIAHYHLGTLLSQEGMISGTSDILYVYLDSTRALLLDAGKHDFTLGNAIRLAGILFDTLPDVGSRAELKGRLYLRKEITREQLGSRIPRGYNSAFQHRDKIYLPPNIGVSCSGHMIMAQTRLDEIMQYWEDCCAQDPRIEIDVKDNSLCLLREGRILTRTRPII